MPTLGRAGPFRLLLALIVVGVTPHAEATPTQKQSGAAMKAPAISYQPLQFSQLSGWDQDDHAAAFKAFLKSCERVLAAARERSAGDKLPGPSPALLEACAGAHYLVTLGRDDAQERITRLAEIARRSA